MRPSVGRDLLPPLAPPRAADEDAQVRVPAVRELGVGVEVEEAVVAAILLAELLERMGAQDRSIHEVLPLEPLLAVDLLRFGCGNLVGRHAREPTAASMPFSHAAGARGRALRSPSRTRRPGSGCRS